MKTTPCPTCGCKPGEEPYNKRWCVDNWHDTNVIRPTKKTEKEK